MKIHINLKTQYSFMCTYYTTNICIYIYMKHKTTQTLPDDQPNNNSRMPATPRRLRFSHSSQPHA